MSYFVEDLRGKRNWVLGHCFKKGTGRIPAEDITVSWMTAREAMHMYLNLSELVLMFLPDGAEILLRISLCSGQPPPSAASALEQKKMQRGMNISAKWTLHKILGIHFAHSEEIWWIARISKDTGVPRVLPSGLLPT